MLAREVVEAFRRNGLINFAAAIAFELMLALVPFLLFLLALLSFLDLGEVWRDDVAPEARSVLSGPAFRLVDDTVTTVLTEKQGWWLSAGLVLTLWEVSAATRVTMTALDRMYGLGRRRSFMELLPRSIWLGIAMCVALVGAVAIARFLPLLVGELDGLVAAGFFVARWLAAAAVLGAGVALVMHYGPATRRTLPWVTFGTVVVMAAWVAMSILFGVYVTYVASYASVFGHLATFFVLLLYVYASANAFLAGVQVDACVREKAR